MNEHTTSNQPPNLFPKPAAKKKPMSPVKSPPKPRTVDPGFAAIADNARLARVALRASRASARILATIIDKRLPKLTPEDKQKLFDLLAQTVTLALPLADETTLALPHPDGGMPIDNAERDV